ncbi:MAG: lytic transglycosylase domain-containing protein [Pyrinomonadaceae bacterium]
MKKISALLFVIALTAATGMAQSRARVFDNFDTRGGVEVATPTVRPIVSSAPVGSRNQKKKTVSKTSMNVSEGLGLNASYTSSSSKLTMGSSKSLKGFSTGDVLIDSYIVESSRRYNVDPLLIYSQMHQESGFRRRATSYKGASGLMQLMPATARRFGVTNIYDPQQNIDAGVKYMRWLLDKFNGDVNLALAGYNAGEGAVMKYGWSIPPYRETQDYVAKITRKYNAISDPSYVRTIGAQPTPTTKNQVATAKKVEQPVEPVYDVDVIAVKLPNGRMRLVNQ